jgi:hypothetical protein
MENASLPRRDLLKGAAYALGAVSLSLMGTRPADAATGNMIYGGFNNASTSPTTLTSTSASSTFLVQNLGGGRALDTYTQSGHSIQAVVGGLGAEGNGVNVVNYGFGHGVHVEKPPEQEFGHAVLAYQKHPTSFYAAIAGVTSGAGPGLHGRGEGSGNGVWGEIGVATKAQSAILGTTEGTGAAIEGRSIKGRGGVFQGKKAQVRLVASSATTKPSTGTRGDLFVDSSGRLWYCKTSGVSTGWVQLA